jgi:hypothetical protein
VTHREERVHGLLALRCVCGDTFDNKERLGRHIHAANRLEQKNPREKGAPSESTRT